MCPGAGLYGDAGDLLTLGIWFSLSRSGLFSVVFQVRVSTGTPVIYSPSAYGPSIVACPGRIVELFEVLT